MSRCDIFFNETLFITFNESMEVKNVSCATGIQTALHGNSQAHNLYNETVKYNFDPLRMNFLTLFQNSSPFWAQNLSSV